MILTSLKGLLTCGKDTWLHITTETVQIRIYNETTRPLTDGSASPDDYDSASYVLSNSCFNTSSEGLPCSLENNSGVLNVVSTESTYLILNTGISQETFNFNELDFASLDDGTFNRSASTDLVVHYTDNKTNITHAFLFWAGAAEETDGYGVGKLGLDFYFYSYGIDYVAQTTSVSTQCTFATRDCSLGQLNSSTPEGASTLYNCYNFFEGDLSRAPSEGIETTAGWSASFYDFTDGTNRSTSLQTSSNPFRFFVAAAPKSINFTDFQDSNPAFTTNGDIVDTGSDGVAFILDCSTTVYDVSYTLISGNITKLSAQPSNETTAAIIKAPLQQSFGTFNLFEQASIAVVSSNPLLDTMELALSETIIAGARGAFNYGVNVAQRERYDRVLTQISKPALLFFVIVCLLYSALGLVLMITAFALRAKQSVRDTQAILLPEIEHTRVLPTDVAEAGSKGVAEADSIRSNENDSRPGSVAGNYLNS